MTDDTIQYKARALQVRQEARARLVEIRNARRARHLAATTSLETDNDPVVAAAPTVAAQDGIEVSAAARSLLPTALDDISTASEDSEPQLPKDPADTPETEGEHLDFPAASASAEPASIEASERELAAGDGHNIAQEPKNHGPADDSAPTAARPPEPSEILATSAPSAEVPDPEGDTIEVSDLRRLPGVGEGLVWALNQQGVHTLADLAAADPDALSHKLSIIGRLLDIPALAKLAQAEIDAAAPN